MSTLALALSGFAAQAQDGLWQPQVRAIIGADNHGGNAALEGFVPLKQTAESVLFLDVRSKDDFDNGFGQDIGLGVRRIVNPDLMVGGYAYVNVQNYDSHHFTGATLGLEAIATRYDAHVNVYLPLGGDETSQESSSSLSLVGHQLLEQVSTLDKRNYAAWGIEGEVGVQVPVDLPDNQSLRLSFGGYHFADPDGDDDSITGAKAGLEYSIGDVFGSGAELTFAGEVSNDNRYDTQFAGSVRLSIPFNPPAGSHADDAPEPVYPVSAGLRKRVNERVRGDIGVRIETQKTSSSLSRVAINADTGKAFGDFFFADGENTLGLGTQGDPTTLDDAVAKAKANGFIVALGGKGNLLTGGVTLSDGQTVIGGGQSVRARLHSGATQTYSFGGSDGTIGGTDPGQAVLSLADGNTIQGVTITGGGIGILGQDINKASLKNVTVSGTGGDGLSFTGTTTGVTGNDLTATGTGGDGLHIEGDGTYNFTGTTLLSDNADDGLDATGQGTYSFATLNATGNADRGITVTGTSVSGSFSTTGGTVSGNGGIGVFIDPITAHVVLDSINQDGGESGVVLAGVAGSFTVNGDTTIADTSDAAIRISDSPASIRFGDVAITDPGADAIVFDGVNAAVVAGDIVISGLGAGTGLDFSGSQTKFTAQSLAITGTDAAGSIGIDLADTFGDAAIVITDGGTIAGVDTGVRLGIAGSRAHTANAEFSFNGGTIGGITAALDMRGLNPVSGHYAFSSTIFDGPQLFDATGLIFVGSSATGTGDGSSVNDLATIATADAITDAAAIFVLVNDGTAIDAGGGFTLSDGQTLASFGNGRTFAGNGAPANVTGDNITHGGEIDDPTGLGAATLTDTGGGATLSLGNGNFVADLIVANGAGGTAIGGNGISGFSGAGITVSGAGTGFAFDGVAGTVSLAGTSISGATVAGLSVANSGATFSFSGTTIDNHATTGAGVVLTGNTGAVSFGGGLTVATREGTGFEATGGGAVNVTASGGDESIVTSAGQALSLDGITANIAFDTIRSTGSAGDGIGLENITGSFTASGTVTNAAGTGVHIGTGSATISFDGLTVAGADTGISLGDVAGSTSFANTSVSGTAGPAITVQNVSGSTVFTDTTINNSATAGGGVSLIFNTGTVSFDGGLHIRTREGTGFEATGSGAVNVTGGVGDSTIETSAGQALSVFGIAADITFDSVTTTGASGEGIDFNNLSGNVAIGETTVEAAGGGVNVSGGSATFDFDTLLIDGTVGSGLTVSSTTGAITVGSASISDTGGPGFTLSGTTGGFSSGAFVVNNAGTNGIDIAGNDGAVTFTNAVTVNGAVGDGMAIADNAGAISFGPIAISDTGGAGIRIYGTNDSISSFGTVEITNPGASGIDLTAADGATISLGVTDIEGLGAAGTGLALSGGLADFTADSLFINRDGGAGGTGIDLSGSQAGTRVTITNGGVIDNVATGVQLGTHGAGGTTANATFVFNGGTIGGTVAALDARGLNAASGTYAFGSTVFTGPQLFDPTNLVFVGATATGTGDGSSIDNLTTIDLADADVSANAVFVLVNRGTAIDDADGFSLSDGQVLASFGNGRTFSEGGVPLNVTGDNVQNGAMISDAGGAATLVSSGSTTTVTLGSGNLLADLDISNAIAGGIAVSGNGIAGLAISGASLAGTSTGVALTNVSGAVNLDTLGITGSGATGIDINGSSATLALSNLTIDVGVYGVNLANASGTIGLQDVSVSGAGNGINIGNSAAAVTLTGTTTDVDNIGLSLTGNVGSTITVDGTTDITAGFGVLFNGGGTLDFSGDTTIHGVNGSAIEVDDGGADLSVGLSNITATGGFAPVISINGTGGGQVTVTDFSNLTVESSGNETGGIVVQGTVAKPVLFGTGAAVGGGPIAVGTAAARVHGDGLSLTNVKGALDLGALAVYNDGGTGLAVDNASFAAGDFTLGNSSGTVDTQNGTAIDLDPLTANLTFGTVVSTNSAASGIRLDQVSGSLSLANTTITGAAANGISITNSDATVSLTNTTVTAAQAGILLTGNAGSMVTLGGTTTINSGLAGVSFTGGGTLAFTGTSTVNSSNASAIDISDGGAAISVALANITTSGGGAAPVISINGTGGGQITVTGFSDLTVNSTGTENGGIVVLGGVPGDPSLPGNTVVFDNGGAAVNGGDLNIATTGARLTGDGLVMGGVEGALTFNDINIRNQSGRGLTIGHFAEPVDFTLGGSGGSIDTQGGPAIGISNTIANVVLDSASSSASTGDGIELAAVEGSFAVHGGTISNSALNGVRVGSSSANTTFTGMTVVNAGADGFYIVDPVGGALTTINSTVTGAVDSAIEFDASTTSASGTLAITGGSYSSDDSALLVAPNAAGPGSATLGLSITGGTFASTGGGLGIEVDACGCTAINITDFGGITIQAPNANAGGIGIAGANFNVTTPGSVTIGSAASPVASIGLGLIDVTGTLDIDRLDVFSADNAPALYADVLSPSDFTLAVADGTLTATDAAAINLLGINADISLSGVSSSNSVDYGIVALGIDGSLSVIGPTTVSDANVGGVFLGGNIADISFAGTTVTDVAGTGIVVAGNTGATTFGTTVVNGSTPSSKGIVVFDNTGDVTFGDTTISAPSDIGLDIEGVNGTVSFGNVDISGVDVTGLDLSDSTSTFTATSLDVTGTGAADSFGIDLSGTAGGSVTIGTGTISGVDTGVQMGTNGAAGATANTTFSFGAAGPSSITGATASLDMRGLDAASGSYAFHGTALSLPQLFDAAGIVFVGAANTGAGDGSTVNDLINAADADDVTTAANTVFVLVGTAAGQTVATDADGFTLAAGQSLVSFANGATVAIGGAPANVTGTNVVTGSTQPDPFGFGAPTLNNSATSAIVLSDQNTVSNLLVSNAGAGAAIDGTGGITGFTSVGVTVVNSITGLDLIGVAGTVTVDNLTVQNATNYGILLQGSGATVDFTGTTTTKGTLGGLLVNDFTGAADFTDLQVNGGGVGVAVTGNAGGLAGSLTFGAASAITDTTSYGFAIDTAKTTVDYEGTITQNNAASAVRINALTAGSATFGGLVTANTGAANAIDLTGNAGGAISFTGGLNIDTTSATGFNATGGGTITVAATAGDESILTTTGRAINLDGVTIGAGGISFDGIGTGTASTTALAFNAVDGGAFSGGNVTVGGATGRGISITNSPATFNFASATIDNTTVYGIELSGANGAVSFGTVDIDASSIDGILIAAATNDVTIGGGTIGATTPMGSVGVLIGNSTATSTISLGNLQIVSQNAQALAISNSDGNVTMAGGTISQTNGVGSAVEISGGTGTVSIDAAIQATGVSAVYVHDATGGSATFGGLITANSGLRDAIELTNNTGAAINFTGGMNLTPDGGYAFHATGGGTISVTGAGNTVTTGAGIHEKGILIDGMTIGAAGLNVSSVTVDGSGGSVASGIDISNTAGGPVTFGGVSINRIESGGTAIRLSNVSGTYTFNGTTSIDTVLDGFAGFVVQNSSATVDVAKLNTVSVTGADVNLLNNSGAITITDGTIANSGTGDGVVVSGGTAAIAIGADITSTAGGGKAAVRVDGIGGGSVGFSGSVSSTASGNLFEVGNTTALSGGSVSFSGPSLTATGGGGAVVGALGAGATFDATAPLTITGGSLLVQNVAGSAIFGAVTVDNSASGGTALSLSGNAGAVTFGTTAVTLGATANSSGIRFFGTNSDVAFGATTVAGLGTGANQTAINFSGSSTAADFGLTTIAGNNNATSRGIDLSSTTGNRVITFLTGSSISGAGVGVELASDHTTATSANADFTFGDGSGTDANGRNSTISATGGNFTVNAVGLDPASGSYNFEDVAFTGNANLPAAPGSVTLVSQSGGLVNAHTTGNLSVTVSTISLADADALTGAQTFAFVGTVNVGATAFTLDSGQTITGFGDGNALSAGTVQPANILGNLGATGGSSITGDAGVVTGNAGATGLLQLLGGNAVGYTAFDFTGGLGSAILIDGLAGGFDNTGGITIEGVSIRNVASGQSAVAVNTATGSLSIVNNDIDIAGRLLDISGGSAAITVSRGALPVSSTAGTLDTGGLIATDFTGAADFADLGVSGVGGADNAIDINQSAAGTGSFSFTNLSVGGFAAGATGNGIDLDVSGSGAVNLTMVSGNSVTAPGDGLHVTHAAPAAGAVALSLDGTTWATTGGGHAINVDSQAINATYVTSFQDNTVLGGAGSGGILFNNVVFDNDGNLGNGTQQVAGGDLNVGQGADSFQRVAGNGLEFNGISGNLAFDTLNVFNDGGTGVLVDTKTAGTTFALGSSAGTVDTTNGTALDLDPLSVAMTLTGVSATNGVNGIILDGADGTFTVTGATSVTGTSAAGIAIANSHGSYTFGAVTINNSTSAGGGVDIDNSVNPGATTVAFGDTLDITTGSGTGLRVGGGAAPSDTNIVANGTGNTIVTGAGTILDLNSIIVGAGGIGFDSVSTTGAATGIALADVAGGGAIDLGTVTLSGITSRGVDVSGTLSAALDFDSLSIGLAAANAIGLDLSAATINAAITAGDFDVNGGGFAGTLGIDMAGAASGANTIQLGSTDNADNLGDQTSTIANVSLGVQVSSATNVNLVFGDGQATAVSSIATFGNGQVIHATDSLPLSGTYDFDDVNFTGDTSNLTPVSIYYVDPDGDGDGSFANPGSIGGAESSTANVIVLIDKAVDATSGIIDMATQTSGGNVNGLDLDDGQVLISFSSGGPATIDVGDLGISAGAGAPPSFSFSTVQTSTVVDRPAGLTANRPTLTTNAGAATIFLPTLSDGIGRITSGIDNILMTNTAAAGDGVLLSSGQLSTFVLRNSDISAAGNAFDILTPVGTTTANTLLLTVDGNTMQSTGGNAAAGFSGQIVGGTASTVAIRSFANNIVTGGAGGGLSFGNVAFDSDGLGGAVDAGTLTVGTNVARVQGDGINFANPIGTLNFTTLNVANNGGTGVLVNTKGAGTTFTLNNTGGSVDTTNGVALNLDPLTVGLTFATVNATGGTSGIILDQVAGSLTINGGSISGTSGDAFSVLGGSIGATYKGSITQASNAALISVAGGHTGTLTFDTGTLSATSGTGLQFDNADGTYNFNGTTTLNGGDAGIDIANGSGGTFTFGAGTTITNPSGIGFRVDSSTASATYSGNITKENGGALVSISSHSTGTITFQTGTLNATLGTGLQFDNADGTYNFNGTTTLNGGDAGIDIVNDSSGGFVFGSGTTITNPSGIGFNVSGGTAGNITYSGTITKNNNAASAVAVSSKTGGTVTFGGLVTASTFTANAIDLSGNGGATFNFNGGLALATSSGTGFLATGGGTVSVTGSGNTITSTSGTALNVANTTIAATGLTFQSISSGSAANSTATGIILDTTGALGGLTVTGTGTAGSGGTIQHKTGVDGSRSTGVGIYLNNTSGVQLANMQLNDFQNFAIRGFGVNGFTMNGVTINGTNGSTTGATAADDAGEGAVFFGNANADGLSGTVSIANSTISGGAARNLSMIDTSNTGGVLHLTLDNDTFGLTQALATGSASVILEARNAGTTSHATVTNSTFDGAAGDLLNFTGQTGTTMDVIVGGAGQGNTFANTHSIDIGGGGVTLASQGVMRFDVENNTFTGAKGSAVTLFKASAGTSYEGTFSNNMIGTSGVANSGSTSGNGIFLSAAGAGTITLAIDNNIIQGINGNAGIWMDNTGGSYTVNATITNNTLRQFGSGAFAGIALTNGAPASTDTVNVFAKISGNNISGPYPAGYFGDIVLGASGNNGGHNFTLSGATAGDVANETAIQNFLAATNTTAFGNMVYSDNPFVANVTFTTSAGLPPLPTSPTP